MSYATENAAEIEKTPDSYEAVAKFGSGIVETFLNASMSAGKLQQKYPETGEQLREFIAEGKKVLRDYYEIYIPEAVERAEYRARPEDELYVRDVMKRKEELLLRVNVLEEIEAGWVSFARMKYEGSLPYSQPGFKLR